MNKNKIENRLTKEEFLERMQNRKLSNTKAIAKLTQQLYEYEQKYNMRSEVFYKLIVGTPLEDQPDFIDWAMCYRAYFRALQFYYLFNDDLLNLKNHLRL